jgi:hypothetical protein
MESKSGAAGLNYYQNKNQQTESRSSSTTSATLTNNDNIQEVQKT